MTTRVLRFDFHGLDVPRCRDAVLNLLDRHAGTDVVIDCIHGMGTGQLRQEIERVASLDPRVARISPDPSNPGVTRLHLTPRPTKTSVVRRAMIDLDEPPERRRRRK